MVTVHCRIVCAVQSKLYWRSTMIRPSSTAGPTSGWRRRSERSYHHLRPVRLARQAGQSSRKVQAGWRSFNPRVVNFNLHCNGSRAEIPRLSVTIRAAAQNHTVSSVLVFWRIVPAVNETWYRHVAHCHRQRFSIRSAHPCPTRTGPLPPSHGTLRAARSSSPWRKWHVLSQDSHMSVAKGRR